MLLVYLSLFNLSYVQLMNALNKLSMYEWFLLSFSSFLIECSLNVFSYYITELGALLAGYLAYKVCFVHKYKRLLGRWNEKTQQLEFYFY